MCEILILKYFVIGLVLLTLALMFCVLVKSIANNK